LELQISNTYYCTVAYIHFTQQAVVDVDRGADGDFTFHYTAFKIHCFPADTVSILGGDEVFINKW
jgi:hypothetical protein